jgi:hypothetical protein
VELKRKIDKKEEEKEKIRKTRRIKIKKMNKWIY